MNWIMQNLGTIIAALAGAGGIAAAVKSFRWARPYERVVVTGPRGLVMDKTNPDKVREYTGFIFRPLGFYRMSLVNIRDRLDNVLIDGVMRPTTENHREKWHLAATVEWHVKQGFVYSACEWQISDIGEFARGMFQRAILDYLETATVTMEIDTSVIYDSCEPKIRDELLDHGVVWTRLMVNTNALADSEIQGQAIRRIARAIEHWVAKLRGEDSSE